MVRIYSLMLAAACIGAVLAPSLSTTAVVIGLVLLLLSEKWADAFARRDAERVTQARIIAAVDSVESLRKDIDEKHRAVLLAVSHASLKSISSR